MPALNKRATGASATPRPPVAVNDITGADAAPQALDAGAIMLRLHAQALTRIPRKMTRILRGRLGVRDILAEIVKLRRFSRRPGTASRYADLQRRLERLAALHDPAITALGDHLEVRAEIADADEVLGESDEWWDVALLLSDSSLTIVLETMPTTPEGIVCVLEYVGSRVSKQEDTPVLTNACSALDPLRLAANTWLARVSAVAARIGAAPCSH